ncbi:Carbon-nitrogen hydrolase, partial [Trinorchestia longiramus]
MAHHQKCSRTVTVLLLIIPVMAAGTRGQNERDTRAPATVVSYRAAATQYSPFSHWQSGPQAILEANFNTMQQLAQNASLQGVDMIVFPEYGLTGTDLGQNKTLFKGLCQVVPHPADASVPCIEDIHAEHYL